MIRAMSTEFDNSQINDQIQKPGIIKPATNTISIYTVAALGEVILLALTAELVRLLSVKRVREE